MAVSLRRRFPPISYDADAKALFTRMDAAGAPTTAARKVLINDMIVGMKADGDWAELDFLQVYAAHAEAAALLNWVKNDHNGTAVNAPTFTADSGYTFDGSTDYINTDYIPLADAVNVGQNDYKAGFYSLGIVGTPADLDVPFGANDTSRTVLQLQAQPTQTRFLWYPNNSAGAEIYNDGVGQFTGNKLYTMGRNGASSTLLYVDGTLVDTGSVSSGALPNYSLAVGGRNKDGTVDRYYAFEGALSYAGSSTINVTNLLARINTFLTAVGAI